MIELSYLQLAHPSFQMSVRAIWDCPNLDGRTSYTAYRIKEKIEKADKDLYQLRVQLLQKHGKKDEAGKLINDERGNITFDKPEDAKVFEEEFTKEFSTRKVSMKVSKLDFEKLTNVRGLTPASWEFIAPIVENLPVFEEDEEPLPEKEEAPVSKKNSVPKLDLV